jgi:hypothetical protein
MLPTKFRFIWPNGYRGEEFLKSANQKQESPMAAMFVNILLLPLLNIDISQIHVQLAMN